MNWCTSSAQTHPWRSTMSQYASFHWVYSEVTVQQLEKRCVEETEREKEKEVSLLAANKK